MDVFGNNLRLKWIISLNFVIHLQNFQQTIALLNVTLLGLVSKYCVVGLLGLNVVIQMALVLSLFLAQVSRRPSESVSLAFIFRCSYMQKRPDSLLALA